MSSRRSRTFGAKNLDDDDYLRASTNKSAAKESKSDFQNKLAASFRAKIKKQEEEMKAMREEKKQEVMKVYQAFYGEKAEQPDAGRDTF